MLKNICEYKIKIVNILIPDIGEIEWKNKSFFIAYMFGFFLISFYHFLPNEVQKWIWKEHFSDLFFIVFLMNLIGLIYAIYGSIISAEEELAENLLVECCIKGAHYIFYLMFPLIPILILSSFLLGFSFIDISVYSMENVYFKYGK